MNVYMVVGLSGSGKTHYIQSQQGETINLAELSEKSEVDQFTPWYWRDIERYFKRELVKKSTCENLYIETTGLKRSSRDNLKRWVEEVLKITPKLVSMEVSSKTIRQRLKSRNEDEWLSIYGGQLLSHDRLTQEEIDTYGGFEKCLS